MELVTALRDGLEYLLAHPGYLLTAARNAVRLEASIPLSLARWLIARRPPGKGPERIALSTEGTSSGALGVELTVDLYGTKLEVAAELAISNIDLAVDRLGFGVRVRNLRVTAPPGSPAAAMIQSMDFSQPGKLLMMMPGKHAEILDVQGDLFSINLLKLSRLAGNARLRRALAVVGDLVAIKQVRAEADLLVVGLAVHCGALPAALARLRSS
jgi:hypothetical protein